MKGGREGEADGRQSSTQGDDEEREGKEMESEDESKGRDEKEKIIQGNMERDGIRKM